MVRGRRNTRPLNVGQRDITTLGCGYLHMFGDTVDDSQALESKFLLRTSFAMTLAAKCELFFDKVKVGLLGF
jgi:hypothetical protein